MNKIEEIEAIGLQVVKTNCDFYAAKCVELAEAVAQAKRENNRLKIRYSKLNVAYLKLWKSMKR